MSKEQLLTSKNEVPKHKNALEEKYKEQKVESVEEAKRIDETNVGSIKDELPQPSGWRLLVLPFTPKEKTKGGITIKDPESVLHYI
jgi:hypothetical protein